MEYFEILNLKREPFSNSPDPDFFFHSRQHVDCLQKLEIAVRLRRGLNIVVGPVGTGKTTLCRQLIRRLGNDPAIETHLMLDPRYPDATMFLRSVAEMFGDQGSDLPDLGESGWKERIKQILFRKGVDEGKILILIIDEGQKITAACLEILRELLNFETNDRKLLQIVLFAQPELEALARDHANVTDRINLYHRLGPLSFRDTCRLIRFRLEQAVEGDQAPRLFTVPGMWAVHRFTFGYPRKIINLCHNCVLAMIIQNRSKAGYRLVRSCSGRLFPEKPPPSRAMKVATAGGLLILAALVAADQYGGAGFFGSTGGIMAAVQHSSPPAGPPAPANAGPGNGLPADAVRKAGNRSAAILGAEEPRTDPQPEGGPAGPKPDAVIRKQPMPRFLGHAAINKGESLSQLIQLVYGGFNGVYLEAVLAANPFIRRVEAIETGNLIHFPAVSTDVGSTGMRCWWAGLDEGADLADTLKQVREYRIQGVPARLIPSYHPETGLRFSIILRGYFFEETDFQKRLAELPRSVAEKARRIRSWGDAQTVFFANPYLM
ncbi:MAG: ExeA family protein [Thermodesulfobacteriota bacterium]